jgi:hypothetical protein
MANNSSRPYVIMFNGPPQSGKDFSTNVATKVCLTAGLRVAQVKVAGPLKDAVHTLHGLDVPTNFFEDRKEQPCEELFGAIPREEYIALSEKYAKTRYGQEFFGKVLVNQMRSLTDDVVVISDCGFQAEVNHVSQYVGPANLLLIRLHRDGCTFKNRDGVEDSRGYVTYSADDLVLDNDGTHLFENKLRASLPAILKRKWNLL